ncbi:MAG: ADYC domain-containing protein, partial [Myxococcota bacterium]
ATAKCIEWGYKRWGSGDECNSDQSNCQSVNLHYWHEACTRMVRADYCGDGVAHTENGTKIDIWDNLEGIMDETPNTDPNYDSTLLYEAQWRPDGAHCIEKTRWSGSGDTTAAYIDTHCPERWASHANNTDCELGDAFTGDARIGTSASSRPLMRNKSGTNTR